MRFIRTAKVGTDPFSQLVSGKPPIEFDHVALGMHPSGFNRIEPGTFGGQQEGQNTNTFACQLDLLIVSANPGANGLALMPGGIIGRSRANSSCLLWAGVRNTTPGTGW
jgi:hypothetical protein